MQTSTVNVSLCTEIDRNAWKVEEPVTEYVDVKLTTDSAGDDPKLDIVGLSVVESKKTIKIQEITEFYFRCGSAAKSVRNRQ